jgi:hypothetical protein
MSWDPGRERVRELADAGEVDRVTPDIMIARRMLEDAGRHLATASQAKVAGDLSGAYQLAYDALRKSAASLLEAQGLRATSRGGISRSKRSSPRSSGRRCASSAHSVGSAGPGTTLSTPAATAQALPPTTSTMPLPSPPKRATRP